MNSASLNIGSYWIKHTSGRTNYYYLTAYGDDYQKIEAPLEICKWFLSPKNIPFCDSIAVFQDDQIEWNFSIQDKYINYFKLPKTDNKQHHNEQICLCTIIDMGEFGSFKTKMINPLLEYAKNKGLAIDGNIYGLLRGRGIENNKLCRYMELRLPIKKQ